MAIEITMYYKKETKNTFVFEAGDSAPIPTLYIRKEGFENSTPPNKIHVTVNRVEGGSDGK